MPEASMQEVIAAYEARGFTGQFGSQVDGQVFCHTCDTAEPAAQTPVLASHRLEGASDPSDMALVAALECVACGQKGTIVLSYGPEASSEDMAVVSELLDDRDQSRVPPGT